VSRWSGSLFTAACTRRFVPAFRHFVDLSHIAPVLLQAYRTQVACLRVYPHGKAKVVHRNSESWFVVSVL
jgi:hypothetical protein